MLESPLPLFPLGIVLLPTEPVPLHIFEPRYKEMVRRCLDENMPFGIVYAAEDAVAEHGCTARIRRVVRRYEDGRLDIVVVGEDRFRVTEIRRDRPYLTANVEALEDKHKQSEPGEVRQRVIAQHMKLLELAGETARPSSYTTPQVSFVVSRNAGLDAADKQTMLEMRSETERLVFLADHLEAMLKRVTRARELHDLARGDGHASGTPEL